jgi:hypothetical protein
LESDTAVIEAAVPEISIHVCRRHRVAFLVWLVDYLVVLFIKFYHNGAIFRWSKFERPILCFSEESLYNNWRDPNAAAPYQKSWNATCHVATIFSEVSQQ